jgi:acetyl esterase/lipase
MRHVWGRRAWCPRRCPPTTLPTLLLHGDGDPTVRLATAVAYHDALVAQGVETDHACMRELDAAVLGLALPRGLTLTWLGTAGYALSYQQHTLLIDPYVSRAGLGAVALGRALRCDGARLDRLLPRAELPSFATMSD